MYCFELCRNSKCFARESSGLDSRGRGDGFRLMIVISTREKKTCASKTCVLVSDYCYGLRVACLNDQMSGER